MPTMAAEYQFVDTWFVPESSPEEVYDVIGDQVSYPRWWGRVFLSVTGDEGPPRPGKKVSIVAKGFLPYKLHFDSETVEAERPKRIRMVLAGDFGGGGEWTFESAEGGTRAQLDWRPSVSKPLVKHLTPLLRPLFRKNHFWTMDRGQEQIGLEVRRRREEPSVAGERSR
jgi:polyketide cyclase/dehydrase/lipid transport protein